MDWRSLLRDLLADRGRILLVTLGVVWGTLSLTVLLASGLAMDGAMQQAPQPRRQSMTCPAN